MGTPNRALGLAYSWTAVLPVLGKHVILDKSGPPAFMIVLNFVGVAVAWYEVGWANLKPSAEKAMQSGPMKLHAMIVGTGFVPYFLVESIGLSFPMVGLAVTFWMLQPSTSDLGKLFFAAPLAFTAWCVYI